MLEKIIPKCYDSPEEQKKLWWHPHSSPSRTSNGTNLIFTSSDKLSFDANKPGAGLLKFDEKRVLTAKGCNKATWKNNSVYDVSHVLSNRKNMAKDPNNGIYYAGIWQEFGLQKSEECTQWAKVSKASIENTRRNFSSFFKWLEDENYIFKSPLRRIHKIKMTHSVKDTYADEELEKLRDDCGELRNLAIIDILNSTGMRVGELVNLDRDDINFNERECLVLGKGDKERVVYFDARAKLHLKKYLKSRTDNNPALFVSLRRPYNRLLTSGVEIMLKKMGKKCNIAHVHPHKFRRTMATTAIDKGMPIEQVQRLLGHEKIDTTLHYAMVKQNNVKISHKKYIG